MWIILQSGLFDNMEKRPIRSAEWKTYTIEGVIDSNSTRIAFCVLAANNGSFFMTIFIWTLKQKVKVEKSIQQRF
ncbi:MAG: hypothetical protein IPN49_16720 [Saprospiraceae bacterium]|nr:hypothetical protein [Saprospiraceae bacterium]